MAKKDEERAIEMTGGTAASLAEALDQWENEREMIGQLHDENQAYTIAVRRFDIAIIMAGKVIDAAERDAGLFFTTKTRKEIQQFREQVEKLQTSRTIARDIALAPHEAHDLPSKSSAGEDTASARSKPHAK